MKIHYCPNYEEMSRSCSDSIIAGLRENPDQLICTATGNSPVGVYRNLAATYTQEAKTFEKLRVIKLDEWGGIPISDPNSCESFIREKILRALHIPLDRYISFKSTATSPEKECERMQHAIQRNGPIDLCILGLGKNGHIGFNEPAEALKPFCHSAQLSQSSLQHEMTSAMKVKPKYGLTLGMGNILQSRRIILLLTGPNKETLISKFLSKRITTELPASFLWLHPNVTCYIDATTV